MHSVTHYSDLAIENDEWIQSSFSQVWMNQIQMDCCNDGECKKTQCRSKMDKSNFFISRRGYE